MEPPVSPLNPEHLLHGYALHQIVVDEQGLPVDYIFLDVNSRFEQLTGLKRNELLNKCVTQILPGIAKAKFNWIQQYGKVAIAGAPLEFIQYSEPLKRWYKVASFSPKKMYFVTLFDDITELKENEEALKKANRAYKATHLSNQALVHIEDEGRLLETICKIIINETGYDLAWAGYFAENPKDSIEIVASSGQDQKFLQDFQQIWRHTSIENTPCGECLRTHEKILIQSIPNEIPPSQWKDLCIAHGFQSVMILPLKINPHNMGVLAIYSKQLVAFDESEISLLDEFASDLAYGIGVHRLKLDLAQHKQNLEQLIGTRTYELQEKNRLLDFELEKNKRLVAENAQFIQDLLVEKEIAQSANKAKSDFLANASHDLRTPLNAIMGFLEILIDAKAGALSAEQKQLLTLVYDNAKFLLDILNDIIDISKIESGRLELKRQPTDMLGVLSRSKLLFSDRAKIGRIRLKMDCSLKNPHLYVDETKMKQVIYNLVSNALKFTPPGGKVDLALTESNASFIMSVSDNGIGIAAENLSKLFYPFQRFSPTVGKSIVGVGLGLYITKKLVELHGGTINVKSIEQQGSTFEVFLPKDRNSIPNLG